MKAMISDIQIEEPCSEKWETMQSDGERRFCISCNKHVTDFTGYTNAEIIKTLAAASTQVCGRLSPSQLNQLNYHLVVAPKNRNWLKYTGVLAITASFFTQEVMASASNCPTEIFAYKKTADTKPASVRKIYGYVYDAAKKPLSGIRVVLNNTRYFALTDKNGRYQITLDAKTELNDAMLSIESVRFSASMKVNLLIEKQSDLTLKVMDPMIVGRISFTKKGTRFL